MVIVVAFLVLVNAAVVAAFVSIIVGQQHALTEDPDSDSEPPSLPSDELV